MNWFIKDVSPALNLLLIPAIWYFVKINKKLGAVMFYLRKVCDCQSPPVKYGKDLE